MSWRGLGAFWAVILVLVATIGAFLQSAGPPAAPPPPPALAAALAPPPNPEQIAAPVAALLEPSRAWAPAMLPRIGPDGRTPRTVYARPFDPADKRPRIALVITSLGMSDAESRTAIQSLPGGVTLSFSPYATNPDTLLDLARKAGHELLVSLPLESQGYPLNDTGSHSLLNGATPQQNATNLDWALSRIQGYVGAVGAIDAMRGERFTEQTANLRTLQDELIRRGLLYVDAVPGRPALPDLPGRPASADQPVRAVEVIVDDPPARAEIEAKLAGLERLAREKGTAVGLAGPLRPVTVERIAAWARGLGDRGIALAPISALTKDAGR